jgi:hypothetical protein
VYWGGGGRLEENAAGNLNEIRGKGAHKFTRKTRSGSRGVAWNGILDW